MAKGKKRATDWQGKKAPTKAQTAFIKAVRAMPIKRRRKDASDEVSV
jgi:hypothetical protein